MVNFFGKHYSNDIVSYRADAELSPKLAVFESIVHRDTTL